MNIAVSRTASEADKMARLDCIRIITEMADSAKTDGNFAFCTAYNLASAAILKSVPEEMYWCPRCNERPATNGRICPYSSEINDNIVECDCCGTCVQECLDGI